MCLSCGCGEPNADHGDSRHVTQEQLKDAADAAGIDVGEAASNIAGSVQK